ncbi:MAG: hypothetical protein OEW37_00460, partial [Rhodospirillaceae bacterium]|nr:hypothetical protein [Rhodospirillaceae bacterium]
MTTVSDNFLSGSNALYVAELYARYLDNASNVDARWAEWFSTLDSDSKSVLSELKGATWAPSDAGVIGKFDNGTGGQWGEEQMQPDGVVSGQEAIDGRNLQSGVTPS